MRDKVESKKEEERWIAVGYILRWGSADRGIGREMDKRHRYSD